MHMCLGMCVCASFFLYVYICLCVCCVLFQGEDKLIGLNKIDQF